ncbi:hypothetical protein BAUCODRAFT_77848 [Baudoinia panamericana UAMH 10762]|uniref:tRNA-dihydrouridine(16/17) synthase [NAD(P)(+)] n=1 Tax=Baudoinia panamericana (strain UAMH 10762) TaxID=717646 RepID=M2MZD1_BAUPA|nr:uncharacterized protein BAUCODRAFT_77848 [Baudoinia panamericana UAMH 10762]EMC92019.1 hypothetical protein BAUCODRAFT_77848 [Baudoinia panamericana UAMH 10762]
MASSKPKLHGRAFYESLGSPKQIVAPMVDQSEFAWRLLTRSFLPPDLRRSILCYSPMLHAKLFADAPKYRASHFQPLKDDDSPHLDGNPKIDRPLFVQFCANDPEVLLEAARHVQDHCDAVDLNLGCPQGIAKRGHYGAFLQEDWGTIHKLIRTLHEGLDIPVTAKMRILETKERTLEYAKMILDAGASVITVHGRRREQKGHNTGLADWSVLRYLRQSLPKDTVIFANGNILQREDVAACLEQTQADGVMSAEGNLYDPSIFADPPAPGEEGREYWRGRDGKGGYRADAVLRRYLDIVHEHVLGERLPERAPLFLPSDLYASVRDVAAPSRPPTDAAGPEADEQPPAKRMQAHCFHLLRPLVAVHHDVRDALARCRAGDIGAFENVLTLTEEAVKVGLLAYERNPTEFEEVEPDGGKEGKDVKVAGVDVERSDAAVRRCKRPYWICQPYVRPLPAEALEKGSMQLSKKERRKLEEKAARDAELVKAGRDEQVVQAEKDAEVPREGMVCG